MKRNGNGSRNLQFSDRAAWGQCLKALVNVLCGTHQEQKVGVDMMLDVLKSDYVCAKRMLSIMDATPAIERDFPELRGICSNTVRGPLANAYRPQTSKPHVKLKTSRRDATANLSGFAHHVGHESQHQIAGRLLPNQ